jgi:hypothetical protein
MSDWPSDFESYLLRDEMGLQFDEEFELVLPAASLTRDPAFEQARVKYQGVAGIYFWIMTSEAGRYRIYVGKTESLAQRLLNYVSGFQAHSPNDYKVQIFKQFMAELTPPGALDLYFAAKDANVLRVAEKDAIRQYYPLLNNLPKPTEEERNRLKEAFSIYYRSALERKLKK